MKWLMPGEQHILSVSIKIKLSAASARADALAEQRADMEQVLAPLVDRQLADAAQLMQLGEGTSRRI